MIDISEWHGRVGSSWASEWERTDRSFSALTDHLLRVASAGDVRCGLDIGCGAGEMSLAMARGHPRAEFVGVDVSPQLIDVAIQRGQRLPNLSFELADAAGWSRDNFVPDVLFSRHGVMFFDDPVRAFAHLASIAAREARLVFSCFRTVSDNPWAKHIMALLPSGSVPPPAPHSPGPFAFADPDYVTDILTEAGWQNATLEPVDYPYIAGTGPDAVEDAVSFFLSIGPAARAIASLDDDEREQFVKRLRGYLTANEHDGMVALHAAAWIVTGSAPSA